MKFLRICGGVHEWGFHVADGNIPSVGDTLLLGYGHKDEEAEEYIKASVAQREWAFDGGQEVWLSVSLEHELPIGMVADSEEWPSKRWSERRDKHQRDLEKIRTTGSL